MKYVIRKAQVRVKPYPRRGKMVIGYVQERPEVFEYARSHEAEMAPKTTYEEQPIETMPGYEEFAEGQIAAGSQKVIPPELAHAHWTTLQTLWNPKTGKYDLDKEHPTDMRLKAARQLVEATHMDKLKAQRRQTAGKWKTSGFPDYKYNYETGGGGKDLIYNHGNVQVFRDVGFYTETGKAHGFHGLANKRTVKKIYYNVYVGGKFNRAERKLDKVKTFVSGLERRAGMVGEGQSGYGPGEIGPDYEKWLKKPQRTYSEVQEHGGYLWERRGHKWFRRSPVVNSFPKEATSHQVAKDYAVSKKEAERIIKQKLGKSISLEDLLKAAQDYKAKWDTIKTILRGEIASGALKNEPRAISEARAKLEAMSAQELSKFGGATSETKHPETKQPETKQSVPTKGTPTGEETHVKMHPRTRKGHIGMVREHRRRIVHNADGSVTSTTVSTRQEQPPEGNIPDVKVMGVATADPQPQIEPTPEEKTPQKTIEFGWGKRKVHHDVGGKIGGAKKERWESVHLGNLAQIEAEGIQTAYKVVSKDKVFKNFDVEADKNSGSTSGASFLKQKILDSVATKPPDSPEMREAYVKASDWLSEMFATKKTVQDVKDWLLELNDITDGHAYELDRVMTKAEYEAVPVPANRSYYQEDRLRVIYGEAYPLKWQGFAPYITRRNRDKDGNETISIFKSSEDQTYLNYRKALGSRFDAGILGRRARKASFWNESMPKARNLETNDDWSWTKSTKERAQGLFDQVKANLETLKQQGTLTPERQVELEGQLKSIEDRIKQMSEKKPGRERTTWRREVGEEVSREGGDPAPEATSATNLKDSFGLKAVEYGNWISDEDATYHIQKSWTALSDLADVLGMPKSEVSMNGRLSLAIGARGTGNAKAYYEPGKKVINLTKFNGGGSVAHEMGHLFDNVLAEIAGGEKGQTAFVSHSTRDLPPDVKSAADGVMVAIKQGGEAAKERAKEKFAKLQSNILSLRTEFYAMPWPKQPLGQEATKESVSAWRAEFAKKEAKRQEINAVVKEINTMHKTSRKEGGGYISNFYQSAQLLGEYWSRSEELFARAFEGYVEDKLRDQMKRKNSYLVSGTRSKYSLGKDEDGSSVEPYPQGEERKRIYAAMERFVEVMKSSGMLRKAMQLLNDILSKARTMGAKDIIPRKKKDTFVRDRQGVVRNTKFIDAKKLRQGFFSGEYEPVKYSHEARFGKAFPGQHGFKMAKQQKGAEEKAEEKKERDESGEPPSQAAERLKRYSKEHRG